MIRLKTKKISMILSIVFIISFIIILIVSIVFTILAYPVIQPQDGTTHIDWFSTQVSASQSMNIPFSIFIQLITTIGGVFFGIRIDQWIKDKDEEQNVSDLWRRINIFLSKLSEGIKNDENMIILAEYKIHWESILRADEIATKQIQNDEKYLELAFAFSFLNFYSSSWNNYNNFRQWELNSSTNERNRIDEWRNGIKELLTYTENKMKKSL